MKDQLSLEEMERYGKSERIAKRQRIEEIIAGKVNYNKDQSSLEMANSSFLDKASTFYSAYRFREIDHDDLLINYKNMHVNDCRNADSIPMDKVKWLLVERAEKIVDDAIKTEYRETIKARH